MQAVRSAVGTICMALCVGLIGFERPAAGQKLEMDVSATQVGKYEKVEFRVHVDTEYHNPFDPDEVDLRAREKISWAILLNPRKRSALGFNISPC